MKSKFSKSWKKSVQPRKQRKYLANSPFHIKRKFMSSKLEKGLKERYKQKSVEVRKNDEVKIMRGRFSKKQGKVLVIDIKNCRVQVDGINITKKDGEKAAVWFHPSNLKIIKLVDNDRKRFKATKKSGEEKSKKEKNLEENKSGGKKDAP